MEQTTSYYIYILWSTSLKKYYVGFTKNVKARVRQHNTSNLNTFTSKHRPWTYKAHFKVNGQKSDALGIEKFIKSQKSQKFIERLIEAESFKGKLAQLVRVPKLRD
ncbi:MAG: GIY-YIG nuclease family protein [Vicingaceae bacterium]